MKNHPANQNKPVRLYTEKHVENLDSIFKDLFQDDVLADVTFHCKDGSVKAHKAILATSSAYFRKVFYEHKQSEAVYLMYGISVKQMRSLVELIYRGTTEVPSEVMSSLFEMVDEMGVKGIVCENQHSGAIVGNPIHNRDTRFRGTKRVAVSFDGLENHPKRTVERRMSSTSTSTTTTERSIRRTVSSSELSEISVDSTIQTSGNSTGQIFPSHQPSLPQISSPFSLIQPKIEPQDGENDRIETTIEHEMNQIAKKTSWQLKQRKFKCQLCSASFKRASHLSRHQLVHTGERPWPCTYCEKAFSRHDKLKNHIRKNHEGVPVSEDSDVMVDVDDSLYTIGHVQFLRPSVNGTQDSFEDDEEQSNKITREDLEPPRLSVALQPPVHVEPPIPQFEPPRKEVLPPPRNLPNEEQKWIGDAITSTQKKGRGRPRKYPPGALPPKLVKLGPVQKKPHNSRFSKKSMELPPPLLEPVVYLENVLLNRDIRTTEYENSSLQLQSFIQNEASVGQLKRKRGRPRKIKVENPFYETIRIPSNVQKKGGIRKRSQRGAHFKHIEAIMPNLIPQDQESDRFEVLEKEKTRGRPKKYPPVVLTLKRKYEQQLTNKKLDKIINIDESTTSSNNDTGSNWSEKNNLGFKRKSARNLDTSTENQKKTRNGTKISGEKKTPTYNMKRKYTRKNGNEIRVKNNYTKRIDNNNVQGRVIKRKYTKKANWWNKETKNKNINEIKLKGKYTNKTEHWKNVKKRKYTKRSDRWNDGWTKQPEKSKKNMIDSVKSVQSPKISPDYRLKRKYTKRAETSSHHEQTPSLDHNITLTHFDSSNNSIDGTFLPVTIKRGRGRPPKNAAVPKPLFKRPRGRPRLGSGQVGRVNPYANQEESGVNILPKPDRGNSSNYDITNMPFGDFESLMSASGDEFMEPYVEIKTEPADHQTSNKEDREFTDAAELDHSQTNTDDPLTNNTDRSDEQRASSFLETIGLSAVNPIGQIGQCTISFSAASGCSDNN